MISSFLHVRATVHSRDAASAELRSPGDAVLVERGRLRWLVMSCPCGCGDELPINLDNRAGPAWRLYVRGKPPKYTLYPSVWRDTGCESHFIVWRSDIFLFNRYSSDLDPLPSEMGESELTEAVHLALPREGFVDVAEIAEKLNELPWDLLRACRRLVRDGRARERKGKPRGLFQRTR